MNCVAAWRTVCFGCSFVRGINVSLGLQRLAAEFDGLAWIRSDLSKAEIYRLERVAERFYETLNKELERIQDFAAKQAARDEIKLIIQDFSCDEKKGFPGSLDSSEMDEKAETFFRHLIVAIKPSMLTNGLR